MKYPHVAARIFNTPLLIHPQKLDAIVAGMGNRLLGSPIVIAAGAQDEPGIKPEMFSTRRGERTDRGYRAVDGVAVLSVSGALVHRSRLDAQSNFLLGYNDLSADLEDAMANPDIHAVLQVYDSPGGEAQGAFEFGQRVFELRGKKPMYAIADGMAASAAYLGASAADQVAVTSTGYAGSIGVVLRHVDFSRMLANEGITVTHIFEGAHKVDGNAFEALPDGVRADLQAELRNLYAMFTAAVSSYRGMTDEAVRATQARTYLGEAAVAAGMANRIATTDQLITELAALRGRLIPVGQTVRSTANDKGATMSGITTEAAGQAPANEVVPSTADVDRARAEGREQGASAERARVNSILGHQGAAANAALAVQCINTGLTIEQAGAILGAAPAVAATPGQGGNAFASVMAAMGNPAVSGVEAGSDAPAGDAAIAASIVAAFRGAAK